MKRSVSVIVSIAFASIFAMSAFGQAKIGWIDSGAFQDDKDGIRKYINAQTAVDNEYKAKFTELDNIAKRIKTLSDDLEKMQANPAIPVDQKVALAKQTEGVNLQKEYNFKKDQYETAYKNRMAEVVGPVSLDIGKAIQDYAKQNGYAVILDIGAMAQANAILALDQTADLTKAFIAYYNTRPATGTASAATPPVKTP